MLDTNGVLLKATHEVPAVLFYPQHMGCQLAAEKMLRKQLKAARLVGWRMFFEICGCFWPRLLQILALS
jgi:hypothetical protein